MPVDFDDKARVQHGHCGDRMTRKEIISTLLVPLSFFHFSDLLLVRAHVTEKVALILFENSYCERKNRRDGSDDE